MVGDAIINRGEVMRNRGVDDVIIGIKGMVT